MRCQEKNKVTFWYCPYLRKEPVLNESGRKTGEQRIVYGDAVLVKGNISAAVGQSQAEVFGNLEQYDKVIVLEDPKFPMDENSVLFVDKNPEYAKDGQPLYDYVVKRAARSLNAVSYAISKAVVG